MVDPRLALDTLLELTRDLRERRPLEESLEEVSDAALRLLPGNHASIRLLDESGKQLVAAVRSGEGSGRPALRFRPGEGLLGWVVEHGRSVRVADVALDPRFEKKLSPQGFVLRSMVSVPMWSAGKVIGVLSVSSGGKGTFSDEDESLLQLLANCAVPPIEMARLERLAELDEQTMALRKGKLPERLKAAMEECAAKGEPLSLLFMDLDHFKRVNDRFGHQAGDAVLQQFAERARRNVRVGDVFVRRGGEEFVMVLPGMSADEAAAVAERIREVMERSRVVVEDGVRIEQTVSIGVVQWDGGESADQLDARADRAMYEAKRRGRNQVFVDRASGYAAVKPGAAGNSPGGS